MIDPSHFGTDEVEITKISSLIDLSSLDARSDTSSAGEHTEIQRIIHMEPEVEQPESAFNLSTMASDLAAPEAEDEDVVVMTRHDEEDRTETEPGRPEGDLVVEEEPPVPPTRQTDDEAETWLREAPVLTDDVDDADLVDVAAPASTSANPWWLMALVVVLFLATLGAMAVVFLGVLT
jgi:hypothetical protein